MIEQNHEEFIINFQNDSEFITVTIVDEANTRQVFQTGGNVITIRYNHKKKIAKILYDTGESQTIHNIQELTEETEILPEGITTCNKKFMEFIEKEYEEYMKKLPEKINKIKSKECER